MYTNEMKFSDVSANALRAYRASLLNTANALARRWSVQSR